MSLILDDAARNLAVLELEVGASWQDVKEKYRFLAKVWHPDRFGDGSKAQHEAEARFKTINTAFQWLSEHKALVDSLAGVEPTIGGGTRSEHPTQRSAAGQARSDRRRRGTDNREYEQRRSPFERTSGTDQGSAGTAMGTTRSASSSRRPPSPPRRTTMPASYKWLLALIGAASIIVFVAVLASRSEPDTDVSAVVQRTESEFTPQDTAPQIVAPRLYYIRYVTVERADVRAGPSASSMIVGSFLRGDPVQVELASGAWYAFRLAGTPEYAWIHSSAVGTNPPEPLRQPAQVLTPKPEGDHATSELERVKATGLQRAEPDLSDLTADERMSVEASCDFYEERSNESVNMRSEYHECLRKTREELQQPE